MALSEWLNGDAFPVLRDKVNAIVTQLNGYIKTEVEIGTWDMDASQTVSVAHGLANVTKIREIKVIIQNDAGTVVYPLNRSSVVSSGTSGGVLLVDSTNVDLYRANSDTFDSTNFNDTGINRGWIIIRSVE